jgi:hypothetical protein
VVAIALAANPLPLVACSTGGGLSTGGVGSGGTSATVTSTGGMQHATGGATGGTTASTKGGTTGSTTGGTTGSTSGGSSGSSTGGCQGRHKQLRRHHWKHSLVAPLEPPRRHHRNRHGRHHRNRRQLWRVCSRKSCSSKRRLWQGSPTTTYKSGANTTYKMTSATLSREYIMYIPSSYDPSKPYRLIFAWHCMGSSDTQCANSDGYYWLKAQDTGNTTIFVAPQGYTDSMPWRSDDKDHTFFDDMLKLFKSDLCIDESRVFTIGFSFGDLSFYIGKGFQRSLRQEQRMYRAGQRA